jgi:hypothetical protein
MGNDATDPSLAPAGAGAVLEMPWDDLKVAYGVDDSEAFYGWVEATREGRSVLPAGWSFCETAGSGVRFVAVFRVEGALRAEDGQAVAEIVGQFKNGRARRLAGRKGR